MKTYRIVVFWKLSELPQARHREIQHSSSSFHHSSSRVFCRTKQGIRGGCCTCACALQLQPLHWALWASLTPQPWGQEKQQPGLGGNQITWGKHKTTPSPCAELCAQRGLILWKQAAQPQHSQWLTNLETSFYLPQLCRASNTDISACTCPLSQALSEWVCCTSPLKLPKRETLTVSYTEGELRRLISPSFPHFSP